MNMNADTGRGGFTLIELMIVVAIIAIIAAIAIPNLLESRMQANESNAVMALKTYSTAQHNWKKAKYGGSGAPFASDYTQLGSKELIPQIFVDANAVDSSGYQGYYFINDPDIVNWSYDFGLYAYPVVYEKSGVNSYWTGAEGTVLQNDAGGQAESTRTTAWSVP